MSPRLAFSCGFWGSNPCTHSKHLLTKPPPQICLLIYCTHFPQMQLCSLESMQAKALNSQNDGTALDPVEKAVEPGVYLSCFPLAEAVTLSGLTWPALVLNADLFPCSLSIRRPSCRLLVRCRLLATWSQAQRKCMFPATAQPLTARAGMYPFSGANQVIASPKVGAGALPMSPLCLGSSRQAVC